MSAKRVEFAASESRRKRFAWNSALLLACVTLLACLPLRASAQDATQMAVQGRRPQAKTQQEREDFNRAYALTTGPASETAANEFSAKYPASELRSYLYSGAMLHYQRENNPEKMLAMGEKVLALDPDNPLALVLTATAVADSLGDRDRDRERKIALVRRNANRAIQSAETGFGQSGDAAALYKTTLQSMAYAAL